MGDLASVFETDFATPWLGNGVPRYQPGGASERQNDNFKLDLTQNSENELMVDELQP